MGVLRLGGREVLLEEFEEKRYYTVEELLVPERVESLFWVERGWYINHFLL